MTFEDWFDLNYEGPTWLEAKDILKAAWEAGNRVGYADGYEDGIKDGYNPYD